MKNNNTMTSGPPTTKLTSVQHLISGEQLTSWLLSTIDNSGATVNNSRASVNAETMQVLILLVKNPKWKTIIIDLHNKKQQLTTWSKGCTTRLLSTGATVNNSRATIGGDRRQGPLTTHVMLPMLGATPEHDVVFKQRRAERKSNNKQQSTFKKAR